MMLILNRLRGTDGLWSKWYILAILGAANRLRGTYGWFAAVFGVVVTVAMYWATGSWLVAVLFGVGYWAGEMICGWGNHIGNLTVQRWSKYDYFPEDGDVVGARWLTSVIVYPKLWRLHLKNAKIGLWNVYPRTMNMSVKGWSLARLLKVDVQLKEIETFVIDKAMTYSRVYLVVRGVYWWAIPMVGVAVLTSNALLGLVGLVLLAVAWPMCAELGYMYSDEVGFEFLGMSFRGGWELQEMFYGAWQTIVFAILIMIGV